MVWLVFLQPKPSCQKTPKSDISLLKPDRATDIGLYGVENVVLYFQTSVPISKDNTDFS